VFGSGVLGEKAGAEVGENSYILFVGEKTGEVGEKV